MVRMTQLAGVDITTLTLVKYPDPRLREMCKAVESFDADLRAWWPGCSR